MVLLLVPIALTACIGQERLHFEGSSGSWEVNYDLLVSEKDSSEQGTVKIKYVGEDETPEQIDYEIKGGSGKSSGNNTALDDGFLEASGSNCSGCAVTQEDDEFDVTIDWAGKTDNFTLKSED